MMQLGSERMPDGLLASSPETISHDFFRDHANHFAELEAAAEQLRAAEPCEVDDIYAVLKARVYRVHGIEVRTAPVEEMSQALRIYDEAGAVVHLSEALDHQNRVFQLAHVHLTVRSDAQRQGYK